VGQVFYPYNPGQGLLLPPSLSEWVPAHLAHFVSDSVDQLDLADLYTRYEKREDGRGQLGYEPRLMLKLLIYAYAVGIFSSRKIARALEELVPLRMLAASNRPSHRTIARFREDNLARFEQLFAQVVRIALGAGLVKMGILAVDGSKVKANASKLHAMNYGHMKEAEQKLLDEIAQIAQRAREIDAAEDLELGPELRGDEVPEELKQRETRLARIREAMARLEAEQAAHDQREGRGQRQPQRLQRPNGIPPDKRQLNFTDPDSRLMKTANGSFEQCYNAQLAVDDAAQIIVAAGVTENAADNAQLLPMEEQAHSNTGVRAQIVVADYGYRSEENFAALEQRGIDAYVAMGRATSPHARRRQGIRGPCIGRMRRKLDTLRGRRIFATRKAIVEPALGWIKHILGFRSFSMRGLHKARGEWFLVCSVINLRRMAKLTAA
jgi:transposase